MKPTVALLACYAALAALQAPAPRSLRPAIDSLPVEFNRIVGVLELPDGTVLISDAGDRRLVSVDFKTKALQQIGREGRGPGEYTVPLQLYSIGGDSTLMPDMLNNRWLIFQGSTFARQVPPDHPAVAATGTRFRGVDARGHVLAGSGRVPAPGTRVIGQGDSTILMLIDRSTGKVDTIGRLREIPTTVITDVGKDGKISQQRFLVGIMAVGEESLIFPDGWLAVARLEPYRIEWRNPDGKWVRPAAIEYAQLRMTDREKQAFLARRSRAEGKPVTPPADNSWWPEFIPPFQTRPMIPLLDGRVLVLRTPTAEVPGNRYDLVDRNGRRVAIVDLPESDRLLAVGTRGVYVIATDQDGIQRIRRHPWP